MSTETTTASEDHSIFQTLDSYAWDEDGEYQIGLRAILGQATDASQIQELTLRAQVFYLARKKNIPIDFDAYKTHLSSESGKNPMQDSNSTSLSSISTSPSISTEAEANASQHASHQPRTPSSSQLPSNPLFLPSADPSTDAASVATIPPTDPSTAPYPPTFAEIVALITSGAPIPGIKEIPPTLVPEKATKPVAKKRRKPWETDVSEEVVQGTAGGTFGDRRDEVIVQELPE